MIGPMLIQSQIPVETCDMIQYRRGGSPWETWQDLPAVPAGYLARGPWVCLGQCPGAREPGDGGGWLWARALDIDEEAEERGRQEATERSELAQRKAGLAVLRGDVEALNYHDAAKILAEAAEKGSYALAAVGLERVHMDGLRYLGNVIGVRSRSKSELIEQLVRRYRP